MSNREWSLLCSLFFFVDLSFFVGIQL
jgi:hypothetical protein